MNRLLWDSHKPKDSAKGKSPCDGQLEMTTKYVPKVVDTNDQRLIILEGESLANNMMCAPRFNHLGRIRPARVFVVEEYTHLILVYRSKLTI